MKSDHNVHRSYPVLSTIDSPQDLRKLPFDQVEKLAFEIRNLIIETVSRTGGHLASNLGVVELTLALHYAFDTPNDKLIWDVGHQIYTHKIITGRSQALQSSLRQYNGISGFPKKKESPFDHYDTGHSSTSISFALGLAESNLIQSREEKVVAIIGDGSMTAGIAFEGLNQSGQLKNENLIVVLNDNEMSISPNVGALSQYISRRMTAPRAAQVRRILKSLLQSIPRAGGDIIRLVQKLERALKDLIQPGLLFEELGYQYLGPFDGHDLKGLIEIFQNITNLPGPLLVHVLTKKGYGYKPSEREPEQFHGAPPFDIKTGKFIKSSGFPSYTTVFGDSLVDLAQEDDRIIAITAAMTLGTGLEKFAKLFPDRFYDVGIAEQHAVAFAGGLSYYGLKPVVAIYSTFLQRAYDQVFHDVCLQELPVIFAIDRGGLVGADGPTHHGVYDLSFLGHLPGIVIIVPRDENELRRALFAAATYHCPVAIRYPRGSGIGIPLEVKTRDLPIGTAEIMRSGTDVTLLAIGPLVYEALAAADNLQKEGIDVEVIDARFAKPLDTPLILQSITRTNALVTVEESALIGGFGSCVLQSLVGQNFNFCNVDMMGIPDRYIGMGSQTELRTEIGLNQTAIEDRIRAVVCRKSAANLPQSDSMVRWVHGLDPSRFIADATNDS